MPHKSDAPGINLGVMAQKLQGSDDILGFIAIKRALTPPVTAEIEAEGGNAVAGNLPGTGPHGTMI